ncbi:M23 family metallopeptidase [Prosthecomicrobium sp. N25]|uniref:M23 family metallopeptidase n=1 Tax=Prosthecomicrobium sp. N25 TaxID=3129254 RepID=UPI0030785BB3
MQSIRAAHDDEIDLGPEPPLRADGSGLPFDRRKVSLRWLAGTVLTGMTSAFLMGGALVVALDGQYTLAATPDTGSDSARSLDRVAINRRDGVLPKADRLRSTADQFATRTVLNLSTMTRVGDKDLIRVRPFVRISASLAQKRSEAMANLPAYNPLKVFADTDILSGKSAGSRNPAFYDAKVEGEVALRTTSFPADSTLFDPDVTMSAGEVERIVRDQARFLTDGTVQTAALPITSDADRFETSFFGGGVASAISLKITPENVSFFAKSDAEKTGAAAGNGLDEKLIPFTNNDSLKGILKEHNADDKLAGEIMKAIARVYDLKNLDQSHRLKIGLAKIDESTKLKPARVSIYKETSHIVTVALNDDGGYVTAQEPDQNENAMADEIGDDNNIPENGPVPTLYQSLYQTALENQIPQTTIRDLVQIFSYDIDFNQKVKPGDSLEVFYSLADENDAKSVQEVLYTSITVGGQPKRFYRYRSPDDGTVDYYDEAGKSAKKFLMRKPMEGGVFRSGFGGRRHPILGYYRMHTGVDWAAPVGTPILAAGNGTIEEAGWKGGYGRQVKIQHANGYETTYNHMSGFGRGIEKGAKVRQGQVVGYVGTTGLSTGPHLHYEVLINAAYVDPMRVRLPRGKELAGPMLAEFRKEREHVDQLMKSPAPAKVAATN